MNEDQEFARLRELFESAERRIKQVEYLTDEVCIPAINQLRYAGFHAIKVLTDCDTPDAKNAELREAESHASRANYDAIEAGVVYLLLKIAEFQHDYRVVGISDVIPDYVTRIVDVRDIQHFLTTLNGRNHLSQLPILDKNFDKISAHYRVFEAARDELNKKVRRARSILLISLGTLALSAFGILVALLVK